MTVNIEETSVVLLEALRRDTGVDTLNYAAPPTRLGGGFWAEILAFGLGDAAPPLAGALVAKLTPSSAHGDREALVQTTVSEQGYPAPPVLVHGTGPARSEGSYFVMPRIEGAPPLSAATTGALLRSVPSLALRLPNLLADLAVRLHRLDPGPLRVALTARAGWPIGIDDLATDIAHAAEGLTDRQLGDAISSALAARPRPERADVICHGDFHPLNVVVGPAGATVVDWTAARLAPPAFDVAFTAFLLAHPPIEAGTALKRPLRTAGSWLARRFVAGYRRRAQAAGWELPAEELSWYTRLHAARILIDVAERDDGAAGHPFALLAGPARQVLGMGNSAD